jgi:hypothetical protein
MHGGSSIEFKLDLRAAQTNLSVIVVGTAGSSRAQIKTPLREKRSFQTVTCLGKGRQPAQQRPIVAISAFGERLLDNEVSRLAVVAFDEATLQQ